MAGGRNCPHAVAFQNDSRIDALYRIGQTINSTLSFQTIVEIVARIMQTDFHATRCFVLLRNADNSLEIVAAVPASIENLHFRIASGGGISGWVAANGKPALVRNARLDPRYVPLQGDENVHAILSVPILVKNEILGVITAEYDAQASRSLRDDDLGFYKHVAELAAIAIENAQVYGKMYDLARTDQLTGALNRHFFMERLKEEVEKAIRYNRPLAIAAFDLDHFKMLNDTQGHLEGDRRLKRICATIKNNLRSLDILGRCGGDEFVAIMPETKADAAVNAVDRIRKTIEQNETPLTLSTGVFELQPGMVRDVSQSEKVAEELLTWADKALYDAKVTRNSVSLYNPQINTFERASE
jgi:diguanylate cyclase (GGDEF)-like protein